MTQVRENKDRGEQAVSETTARYIRMADAVCSGFKVYLANSGQEQAVDFNFMLAVEKHCGVDPTTDDDFRRSVASMAGMCMMLDRDYTHNIRLRKAVASYLTELHPGQTFPALWTDDRPVVYLNAETLVDRYIREAARYVIWPDLNPAQKEGQEPDEGFMLDFEKCGEIPEQMADEHRRFIAAKAGALLVEGEGRRPDWTEQLFPKLFEAARVYVANAARQSNEEASSDPCHVVVADEHTGS